MNIEQWRIAYDMPRTRNMCVEDMLHIEALAGS